MIKKIIKKIPGFKYINIIRKSFDFNEDKKFFMNNYIYSEPITKEKVDYELLLEIHKLEKGFAVLNPRPFGIDKIKKIIFLLKIYEEKKYKCDYAYNMSCSALEAYVKFYEEKGWTDTEQYKISSDFIKNKVYEKKLVGAFDYCYNDYIDNAQINYGKFLESRKSVRNFSNRVLKENDIKKATEIAILSPSACNRQMCKVYYISDNNKKIVEKYAQGLGLFDLKNANYVIITFDVSSSYFTGERNQGWLNSGLFSMNFVNALHSLGIGSCFIQFGNSFKEEKEMKNLLNIPKSERIAVIITCGYYDELSRVPYSTRKDLSDIYTKI